jgi:hypothetical protein
MEVGFNFNYFGHDYTINKIVNTEESFPMTFTTWFSAIDRYGRQDSFRAEYCEGSDVFEWIERIQVA